MSGSELLKSARSLRTLQASVGFFLICCKAHKRVNFKISMWLLNKKKPRAVWRGRATLLSPPGNNRGVTEGGHGTAHQGTIGPSRGAGWLASCCPPSTKDRAQPASQPAPPPRAPLGLMDLSGHRPVLNGMSRGGSEGRWASTPPPPRFCKCTRGGGGAGDVVPDNIVFLPSTGKSCQVMIKRETGLFNLRSLRIGFLALILFSAVRSPPGRVGVILVDMLCNHTCFIGSVCTYTLYIVNTWKQMTAKAPAFSSVC